MSARRCKCGRPIERVLDDLDGAGGCEVEFPPDDPLRATGIDGYTAKVVYPGHCAHPGCTREALILCEEHKAGASPDGETRRAPERSAAATLVDRPAARPQPRTIVKPPGDPSTDRASRPLRCRLGLHRWDFETWERRKYPWTEPLRCSLCGRTKR